MMGFKICFDCGQDLKAESNLEIMESDRDRLQAENKRLMEALELLKKGSTNYLDITIIDQALKGGE